MCLQAQWSKAATAAANFLLVTGQRGLVLMKDMEYHQSIAPGTFRVLEGLYVPEDYVKVLDCMQLEQKPSVSKFKDLVHTVMYERWLLWAITHPELPDSKIHPSRRVLSSFVCMSLPGNQTMISVISTDSISMSMGLWTGGSSFMKRYGVSVHCCHSQKPPGRRRPLPGC